jgi:excisionase family DNA binding protein
MPPLQKPLPINERAAFTVKNACLYTDISRTKMYRLMDAGVVEYAQVDKQRKIFRKSLDRLIRLPENG